jgi:GH25 family lysozyme M1 (1,4-beta-N-acetylmuramidase)
MIRWTEGIDISVYQGSVSEAKWRELYQLGQRLAVVGSWHGLSANPYAEGNLIRADAAGLKVATYVALNAGGGRRAVEQGRKACGRMWDKLCFVAIDCEIDGITTITIMAAIEEVRRLNKRPCIYTARWWWRDHFGDRQGFQAIPLWNAYYDGDPDIDFASASYGGWTLDKVIGEQYAGSVPLAGITVDRNSFDMDWIEEEDDMSAIEDLRQDVARLTAENGLQQGALELQKRINELQQGWLEQHAAEHATAPELIPPLPPELAERVAELEAKVSEAGAALAG